MTARIAPRHELRHWAVRYPDGFIHILCDRGDAILEMAGSDRYANPQMYAAWRKLVRAQMDKDVEESICQQMGGHQTVIDGTCVECLAYVDWDAVVAEFKAD
jgi:hypothetical protein